MNKLKTIETRTSRKILVGIIILLIIFVEPTPISNAEQESVDITTGITYLSTHWHYEPGYLSDIEIRRDFSLFSESGLSHITLVLVWKYLEPSPGVYNDEALSDILHICELAEEYDLQVIIDFHTMMHENSFTIPEWIQPRKFEQVFYNQTTREHWLMYLDHCVSNLRVINNIHSWHMMNEPARSLYPETDNWACNASIDEFVELWDEMRSIFKSHSDKPVSIRFGGESFDRYFERDPRIYTICDYISLNWYEEFCSRDKLIDMVSEIQQFTPVVISEFGLETDDDFLQKEAYDDYLDLFNQNGINEIVAWYWRADYDKGNPSPPGYGFNLAGNVDGYPRPGFTSLIFEEKPGFVIPESPGGTMTIVTLMIVSLLGRKHIIARDFKTRPIG